MPQIHPTSVVDHGAEIDDSAVIGPLCYVGPNVKIGPRTRLVSHVSVLGHTTIGADNQIFPQAVLGAAPQDRKYRGEPSQLVIGDRNQIRELVTAHIGTAHDVGITSIGDDNLIMAATHIAHDCVIGSHITIANGVGLAGHVKVMDWANIGGMVGCHHFVTIGEYSFVGGMSRLTKDVPPFMVAEGNPLRVRKVNTVALERAEFTADQIERIEEAYRRLFRSSGANGPNASGSAGSTGPTNGVERHSMADGLEELDAQYPNDPHIGLLTEFMRNRMDGRYGRHRELERKDVNT